MRLIYSRRDGCFLTNGLDYKNRTQRMLEAPKNMPPRMPAIVIATDYKFLINQFQLKNDVSS